MTLLIMIIDKAAPLLAAGIGAAISSAVGIVNVGLEASMLMGALFSSMFAYFLGDLYLGVVLGLVVTFLFSTIQAIVVIKYRAAHVITGIAMNLLAIGVAPFIMKVVFGMPSNSPRTELMPKFFGVSLLVYIIFGLSYVAFWLLKRSKIGLYIRAVGENRKVAHTLGFKVELIEFIALSLSNLLAALGGAFLSVGALGYFAENMSAGRGFIALTIAIVGDNHPIRVALFSLFFGLLSSIQLLLQGNWSVPSQLTNSIPYAVTLIFLIARNRIRAKKLRDKETA